VFFSFTISEPAFYFVVVYFVSYTSRMFTFVVKTRDLTNNINASCIVCIKRSLSKSFNIIL